MNSAGDIIFSLGPQIASFKISSSSYSWSIETPSLADTMGLVFGHPDTSFAAYLATDQANCFLTLL
jgi:hypothetical protein